MHVVSSYPQAVRELAHVEVPMPDGCRLGARIWMPEGAETEPVPAILEYLPYRKNDLTAHRDASMHPYVAGHGYAIVRLDLRGAGDSEGLMLDEYLPQELRDGADAIAWIAEQPWCDGNVGMIGISWGGFNGLQVAALQPPALKAIITLCSTDDRYADDVHYMGGCLLLDQLSWASVMFGRNTLPPDPRNVGERWRDLWHARLRDSGLWLKTWLQHQTRDEFWKHGSVCEDWSRIRIPVYAASGWADGYCRSVFRLMENLQGPKKGMVGPWGHKYPHIGAPGPAIGFLTEELRWWDHWLKGKDTGIMDEPMLRLYMQDGAAPAAWYAQRPGRWVAEPSWPSPNIERTAFRLGADGSLVAAPGEPPAGVLAHRSPLSVGMLAGKWCSYGGPGDAPPDQRAEDAGSLCFETAPLSEALEMAGDANLTLALSADRPCAQVAARLVDVAPDGAATRVSYGVLNLTHRGGHEAPEPLEPGTRYTVTVPMKHVAQRFEAGHRIRLSISTSYFPIIWPAPEPVTLSVHTGASVLELPLRRPSPRDAQLRDFGLAEASPPLEAETVAPPEVATRVVHDLVSDAWEMHDADGAGTFRILASDLTVHNQGHVTFRVEHDDPSTVSGEATWEHAMSRGDWSTRSTTWTRLTADADRFIVHARLQAWEGDELAHEEEWHETIPRNLV
jgi:hypothetical protein